jgi:hypothetical protein
MGLHGRQTFLAAEGPKGPTEINFVSSTPPVPPPELKPEPENEYPKALH